MWESRLPLTRRPTQRKRRRRQQKWYGQGTPLEGYVNIGIANVEDNLNIRESADEGSDLVGKLRKNASCEVLGYEGEWAHIQSGEVEGYVKAPYLYTGRKPIDLAFQLGQTVAKVTTDALYVRMEPSTEADYWTMVPNGEELTVIEIWATG